ncbi:FAD:protein FMN transferase [Sorangium sp. So ce1000]|uniref:FAD:protein FMN transferase n=1 Tax=Sorangium sp. So ce1000 TaxID=3133325 RepID=UPI003F616A1F
MLLAACDPGRSAAVDARAHGTLDAGADVSRADEPPPAERSFDLAIGTSAVVRVYSTKCIEAMDGGLAELVEKPLIRIALELETDVKNLNGADGGAVEIGDDTRRVLEHAIEANENSLGAFDVSFSPLADLWQLTCELPEPDAGARSEAQRKVGISKVLHMDTRCSPPRDSSCVTLERESQINLNGINRGYLVERARKMLEDANCDRFYVQIGGVTYVRGSGDGKPWRVLLRDPRGGRDAHFGSVTLDAGAGIAFSATGDYEKYVECDGRRRHRIIDIDAGEPADKAFGVTVFADDAITADTVDDEVFIRGPEGGKDATTHRAAVGGVIAIDTKSDVYVYKKDERVTVRIDRYPTAPDGGSR